MGKTYSGVVYDLDINEYHKQLPLEDHYWSSTQIKDVLVDPELFYKKYITKEIEKDSSKAFNVGHYYHAAILEPETVETDFVIYPGIRRSGKKWDKFEEENSDKIILTTTDLENGEILVKATKESPIAMDLLKNGKAETSLFTSLYIYDEEVFFISDSGKTYLLDIYHGFLSTTKTFPLDKAIEIKVKVRSDYMTDSYILDLKSTSSNAKSLFEISKATEKYNYDISAALYLDLFNLYYGFSLKHFYWTFASKSKHNSMTYVASDEMILVGRSKWKKAVVTLADLIESDFEFTDELGEIAPFSYQKDMWLKKESHNKQKKNDIQDSLDLI